MKVVQPTGLEFDDKETRVSMKTKISVETRTAMETSISMETRISTETRVSRKTRISMLVLRTTTTPSQATAHERNSRIKNILRPFFYESDARFRFSRENR